MKNIPKSVTVRKTDIKRLTFTNKNEVYTDMYEWTFGWD